LIHCWELVCHEGSGDAEKGERSLPLHFCKPPTMECIYKIRKVLRFLFDCESLWIAMGSCTARHLITSAVVGTEDDDTLAYVKGYKKREWLKDMLESER